MLLRIASLVLLVAILAAGSWYFFRDTPEKKVARWRELVADYLECERLEEAERWQDEVLKYSRAHRDRLLKASICERKNTASGLLEALATYEAILEDPAPSSQAAALHTARVLRSLGRYEEAYAASLSVMDHFPFAASASMAEIARAENRPERALEHYRQALRCVADAGVRRKAWALEGIARSCRELRALRLARLAERRAVASSGGTFPDHDAAERGIADLEREARDAIRSGLRALDAAPPVPPDEVAAQAISLARLYLELAAFRRPGEDVSRVGALAVEEYLSARGVPLEAGGPSLLIRIGALHLGARRELEEDRPLEAAAAAAHARRAEERFFMALARVPAGAGAPHIGDAPAGLATAESGTEREVPAAGTAAGATALGPAPRRPLRALADICRVYLIHGRPDALLTASEPPLALAVRVRQARAAADPEVRRLFSLLAGLAAQAAGREAEARAVFREFLESVPGELRPAATVRLARRIQEVAPDSSSGLELIEAAEMSGLGPFDHVAVRAQVTIEALARPALRDRARSAAGRWVERARAAAWSDREHLAAHRLVELFFGPDRALETLRSLRERARRGPAETRRAVVLLAARHANRLEAAGDRDRAAALWHDVLEDVAVLYLGNPAADDGAPSRLRRLLERLRPLGEVPRLEEAAGAAVPELNLEGRRALARGLEAYVAGDPEGALRALEQCEAEGPAGAPIAYLRGSAHLLKARALLESAAGGELDGKLRERLALERAAARRELERHPLFPAIRVELLHMRLRELGPEGDVPESLSREIEELSAAGGAGHLGQWLLVQALAHRLKVRYLDTARRNSDVAAVRVRLETAIRRLLRMEPGFVPAILALAEVHTVGLYDATGPVKRDLFPVDYEKAISVLRGAPRPAPPLLERLGDYLLALAREPRASSPERDRARLEGEALRALEALALLQPSRARFDRLASAYVETGAFAALERLAGAPDPATAAPEPTGGATTSDPLPEDALGPDPAVAGLSPGMLLRYVRGALTADSAQGANRSVRHALRVRLDRLPQAAALRSMYRGLALARRARDAGPTLARSLRDKSVSRYLEALGEFDAAGVEPPLGLLNDLAWHLAEDEDAARRSHGLELAKRAVGRVPDPGASPDLHDTYAWALYRNERYLEAEAGFRRILENEERPTFRYHLALALVALGRHEEALRVLEEALSSPREFPEEREARGLAERLLTASAHRNG